MMKKIDLGIPALDSRGKETPLPDGKTLLLSHLFVDAISVDEECPFNPRRISEIVDGLNKDGVITIHESDSATLKEWIEKTYKLTPLTKGRLLFACDKAVEE